MLARLSPTGVEALTTRPPTRVPGVDVADRVGQRVRPFAEERRWVLAVRVGVAVVAVATAQIIIEPS